MLRAKCVQWVCRWTIIWECAFQYLWRIWLIRDFGSFNPTIENIKCPNFCRELIITENKKLIYFLQSKLLHVFTWTVFCTNCVNNIKKIVWLTVSEFGYIFHVLSVDDLYIKYKVVCVKNIAIWNRGIIQLFAAFEIICRFQHSCREDDCKAVICTAVIRCLTSALFAVENNTILFTWCSAGVGIQRYGCGAEKLYVRTTNSGP